MKAIHLQLTDEDLNEILRQYFLNRGFEYGGSQRERGDMPPLVVQLYVEDFGGLRND